MTAPRPVPAPAAGRARPAPVPAAERARRDAAPAAGRVRRDPVGPVRGDAAGRLCPSGVPQ